MNKGGVLAAILMITTFLLVGIGTLWPVPSAVAYAGGEGLLQTSATAEAAVQKLGGEIRSQAWEKAYSSLANQSEFTETEFIHDITGYYPSLRTYATLDTFEALPMHESEDAADYQVNFHWSTVVGTSLSKRDVHVVKVGDRWEAEWPIVKEASVPPQVIPVTFLRWDVIYRGPGDDWGSQDVDAPHVRIVDMHAVQRASGVVVLGELLNEDVVPAYVSVSATLLSKDQSPISTEDSFDKISHLLLPKQVTPFLINFPTRYCPKSAA